MTGRVVVHMFLRGLNLMLMVTALFYATDRESLPVSPDAFITIGVYSAFSVITLGLIIDVSMHMGNDNRDIFVECVLLCMGFLWNIVCTGLSFIEFKYVSNWSAHAAANKGLMSILGAIVYLIDGIILLWD